MVCCQHKQSSYFTTLILNPGASSQIPFLRFVVIMNSRTCGSYVVYNPTHHLRTMQPWRLSPVHTLTLMTWWFVGTKVQTRTKKPRLVMILQQHLPSPACSDPGADRQLCLKSLSLKPATTVSYDLEQHLRERETRTVTTKLCRSSSWSLLNSNCKYTRGTNK